MSTILGHPQRDHAYAQMPGILHRAPIVRRIRRSIGAVVALLIFASSSVGEVPPYKEFYKQSQPISSGDGEESHVVILSGILGPQAATFKFIDTLKQQRDGKPSEKISAQVWEWNKIVPPSSMLHLLNQTKENKLRARAFAQRLNEWKQAHRKSPTRLYLLVGSAGGIIADLACDHKESQLDEDFMFERIVFVSTTVSKEQSLTVVRDHSRGNLYNYYSGNDELIKGLGTPAGVAAFDDPTVYQLRWDEEKHSVLGNNGSHLGCYADAFARKYLLPLFLSEPTAEMKAHLKEWVLQKHDDP